MVHDDGNIINLIASTKQACQMRFQDLVKGGAPGAEAENCRRSEAELHLERSEQFAATGNPGPA